MSLSNPLVEQQYTEWVYPEPITDIVAWKAQGNFQTCDPSLHHAIIWPERTPNPKLSILVAGCGTSQAAILAFNNPEATVIGIDLSPTSLDYSNRLKQKHNIANLTLRQMDLNDVATLGQKFDLIYSTGVLHHLPDPQKGLQCLASSLGDDGVLCLMLYGKYPRAGVYMMQEALRRMNIQQTPADIAFTRKIIASLPPWHCAQSYIASAAHDLVFDGGLVDTFLHPQDRAYSVPDILALATSCNLSFQSWIDNLYYYPDGVIPADHPAYQRIASLPDEEQWAVVELLMQTLGVHGFLLRKKSANESKFRLNYNSPDFLKMIPTQRGGIIQTEQNSVLNLRRSWHSMQLTNLERGLFQAVNSQASIEQIIAHTAEKVLALGFFKRMGRLGHFVYAQPTALNS